LAEQRAEDDGAPALREARKEAQTDTEGRAEGPAAAVHVALAGVLEAQMAVAQEVLVVGSVALPMGKVVV